MGARVIGTEVAKLIADIAFRSTFPDRELEREKEVIADEINTYKDSPADLIYDTFEEMLFAGSELEIGRASCRERVSSPV